MTLNCNYISSLLFIVIVFDFEEALRIRRLNVLLLCPIDEIALHGVGVLAVGVVFGLNFAYPERDKI